MPWRFKDPSTFPADFPRAAFAAAADPEAKIVLAPAPNYSSAQALAEKFRWWKWCISQKPFHHQALDELLRNYDLRTLARKEPGSGYVVYVRARVNVLDSIFELNPHIRPIISAIGQ